MSHAKHRAMLGKRSRGKKERCDIGNGGRSSYLHEYSIDPLRLPTAFCRISSPPLWPIPSHLAARLAYPKQPSRWRNSSILQYRGKRAGHRLRGRDSIERRAGTCRELAYRRFAEYLHPRPRRAVAFASCLHSAALLWPVSSFYCSIGIHFCLCLVGLCPVRRFTVQVSLS